MNITAILFIVLSFLGLHTPSVTTEVIVATSTPVHAQYIRSTSTPSSTQVITLDEPILLPERIEVVVHTPPPLIAPTPAAVAAPIPTVDTAISQPVPVATTLEVQNITVRQPILINCTGMPIASLFVAVLDQNGIPMIGQEVITKSDASGEVSGITAQTDYLFNDIKLGTGVRLNHKLRNVEKGMVGIHVKAGSLEQIVNVSVEDALDKPSERPAYCDPIRTQTP